MTSGDVSSVSAGKSGCFFDRYTKSGEGYELAIKATLLRLLVLLIRGHVDRRLTKRECDARDLNNRRLAAVFGYIEKNAGEQIQLEKLASLANVSPYYFCKLFRAATGTTFVEYINRRRMEKAEMMLRESEKSVTEIAYECGIPDSNYFSRMFKKYRGASPSELRRASK